MTKHATPTPPEILFYILAGIFIVFAFAFCGCADFETEVRNGNVNGMYSYHGTWHETTVAVGIITPTLKDGFLDLTEFDPPEFTDGTEVMVIWDSSKGKPYLIEEFEGKAQTELYALNGIITEINHTKETVTVTDYAGNNWTFEGNDWHLGEEVSMIMDKNRDFNVMDDCVINVHYNGAWNE